MKEAIMNCFFFDNREKVFENNEPVREELRVLLPLQPRVWPVLLSNTQIT